MYLGSGMIRGIGPVYGRHPRQGLGLSRAHRDSERGVRPARAQTSGFRGTVQRAADHDLGGIAELGDGPVGSVLWLP